MASSAVSLTEKLGLFTEHWSPKIVARMNEHHFKLVKMQGESVWHSHAETDEVFLVLNGMLRIAFRESEVKFSQGEMLVRPKGVENKPSARDECHVLLVERMGTINTGDAAESRLAAGEGEWL